MAYKILHFLNAVKARNVRLEFVAHSDGNMGFGFDGPNPFTDNCEMSIKFDMRVLQDSWSITDTEAIEGCSDSINLFGYRMAAD